MSAHSSPITSMEEVGPLYKEETVQNLYMKMPEPVHYVSDPLMRSKDDVSMYAETTASDSTPSSNGILAEARNERRYRLLLEHQFHPSRKLPMNFTSQ